MRGTGAVEQKREDLVLRKLRKCGQHRSPAGKKSLDLVSGPTSRGGSNKSGLVLVSIQKEDRPVYPPGGKTRIGKKKEFDPAKKKEKALLSKQKSA